MLCHVTQNCRSDSCIKYMYTQYKPCCDRLTEIPEVKKELSPKAALALVIVIPIIVVCIITPLLILYFRYKHRQRMEELSARESCLLDRDELRVTQVSDSSLKVHLTHSHSCQ